MRLANYYDFVYPSGTVIRVNVYSSMENSDFFIEYPPDFYRIKHVEGIESDEFPQTLYNQNRWYEKFDEFKRVDMHGFRERNGPLYRWTEYHFAETCDCNVSEDPSCPCINREITVPRNNPVKCTLCDRRSAIIFDKKDRPPVCVVCSLKIDEIKKENKKSENEKEYENHTKK